MQSLKTLARTRMFNYSHFDQMHERMFCQPSIDQSRYSKYHRGTSNICTCEYCLIRCLTGAGECIQHNQCWRKCPKFAHLSYCYYGSRFFQLSFHCEERVTLAFSTVRGTHTQSVQPRTNRKLEHFRHSHHIDTTFFTWRSIHSCSKQIVFCLSADV